jgi:uncharacterized protein YggU (UPF0235/DUF167 family)
MTESAWRAVEGGLEVRVRVTPRGGRDAIDGVGPLSDRTLILKLRVRAVPEDGAANEAVRRILARALDVATAAVSLRAGPTARIKTLLVQGGPRLLSERLTHLAGANLS